MSRSDLISNFPRRALTTVQWVMVRFPSQTPTHQCVLHQELPVENDGVRVFGRPAENDARTHEAFPSRVGA